MELGRYDTWGKLRREKKGRWHKRGIGEHVGLWGGGGVSEMGGERKPPQKQVKNKDDSILQKMSKEFWAWGEQLSQKRQ